MVSDVVGTSGVVFIASGNAFLSVTFSISCA
jgi:hypothetical protein